MFMAQNIKTLITSKYFAHFFVFDLMEGAIVHMLSITFVIYS